MAVIDASALLALLQNEPGSDIVASLLDDGSMTSVNWSEVVQKTLARGLSTVNLRSDVTSLGLAIIPLDAQLAEDTAKLWAETRAFGLSLGDRACLALARRLGQPAVTADRAWLAYSGDVEVRSIRP